MASLMNMIAQYPKIKVLLTPYEIKHTEKDWRYYPPQVKETHENSAHEFCLSKYPWSSK